MWTRRRVLKVAGSALLALGVLGSFTRTRGYSLPSGVTLRTLSPWQFVTLAAIARRIVDPDDAKMPTADDAGVAAFADEFLLNCTALARRDFGRLLAYVEHVAPLRSGHSSRFSKLGAPEQDAVLAGIEASSIEKLRGGFSALKSMVMMGYYRLPSTWNALKYDGPWIRPQALP